MRSLIAFTAVASLAALALTPTPSLAMERLAKPSGAATVVTRIADSDRPRRFRMIHIYHRKPAWLVRAHANRWLHYQYVNAGYPVRHTHRSTYTYFPGPLCCGYYGHW
jgi:hypothetical protein